jgi:hypothetical protein
VSTPRPDSLPCIPVSEGSNTVVPGRINDDGNNYIRFYLVGRGCEFFGAPLALTTAIANISDRKKVDSPRLDSRNYLQLVLLRNRRWPGPRTTVSEFSKEAPYVLQEMRSGNAK